MPGLAREDLPWEAPGGLCLFGLLTDIAFTVHAFAENPSERMDDRLNPAAGPRAGPGSMAL